MANWKKANREVLRAMEKAHAMMNESYSDAVTDKVNDELVKVLGALVNLRDTVIREEGEVPKGLSFLSFMTKARSIVRAIEPNLVKSGYQPFSMKKSYGGDFVVIATRSYNPFESHADFNSAWDKTWKSEMQALKAIQQKFGGFIGKVERKDMGTYVLSEVRLVIKGGK